MKLKKILKIMISIILISIIISIWLPNDVNAALTIERLTGDTTGTSDVSTAGNKIVQIVSTVGSILSVIVIIVLGIKYMYGSVDAKASVKESLTTLLVACIFFFGWNSIKNLLFPNILRIISLTNIK